MSKIAELNDQFRVTFDRRLGAVILTDAVAEMHLAAQMSVIEGVKTFDVFTPANDPRGEHDFGEFEVEGERYCWKIDYCAPNLELCTNNPGDSNYGNRVLMIMFSDEYWNRFLAS